TGRGLFLFKLRLHFSKPFFFSTASERFPTQSGQEASSGDRLGDWRATFGPLKGHCVCIDNKEQ
ncbi:MAG: hypothetical protein DME27_00465, partial [Verrucomicrobia bacterium]